MIKFWKYLIGAESDLPARIVLVNATLLSVASFLSLLLPVLIYVHLWEISLVDAMSVFFLLLGWSVSRYLSMSNLALVILAFCAVFSVFFSFATSGGIDGPAYIMIIVSMMTLLGVFPPRHQWVVLTGHVLLAAFTLGFDYFQPNDLVHDISAEEKYVIFFLTMVISLVIIFVIYRRTINGYQQAEIALREKDEQNKKLADSLTLSNAEKDRLFSVLAHDIRSPLASVHYAMELFAQDELSHDERHEVAAEIHAITKSTMFLVENLLYWSKHETGNTSGISDVFNLDEILIQIRNMFMPIAKRKQIQLEISTGKGYLIEGHKNAIEVMLRNVVHNAIKFTPFNGSVTLDCESQEDNLKMTIQDSGMGLSPDEFFESSISSSTKGTAGELGTGLGLQLIKSLAERQKIKVHVSNPPSGGTKFEFIFRMGIEEE